jgi:hypothetical protein
MELRPFPVWHCHVYGSRLLLRVDASHFERLRFNLLEVRKMLGSWYPVLSIIVGICGIAVSAQKGRDRNPLTDFCRLFGHATAEVDRKLFIDGGLFDSNPISGNKYNLTSMSSLCVHVEKLQLMDLRYLSAAQRSQCHFPGYATACCELFQKCVYPVSFRRHSLGRRREQVHISVWR